MANTNTKIVRFIWALAISIMLITGCTSNNKSSTSSGSTSKTMKITGVEPASGIAGTNITIHGSGFNNVKGDIKFGDTPAPINSWSDTSISAVVPDITAGNIRITVISGSNTSSSDFTVLPFILSINKTDVILNDTIVITGTGFGSVQGGSSIYFAGTVLPVTAWSNNQLIASINNITHAVIGLMNVSVNNVLSNGVTITTHPFISNISPDTAERGDEISITGNLFGDMQGINSVTFAGSIAPIISWSDNLIRVKVPDNAVKGNVIVTVNGIPSTGIGFTVTKTIYALNTPSGIAIDDVGNLYTANYTDGTVIKVLPGGLTQTTIYKGLNKPMGLYYMSPSTLYIACEGDGTIQRLTLGSQVTGYTYASGFSMPTGIAIDDTGNMYVTNYGSNSLSKIDLSGVVSTFAVGLNKPMGIVFTGPAGGKTFYVINNGNNAISMVNLLGVVSTYVTGIDTPKYIIADSSYNLYVTSGNRIVKILSPSGFVTTYALGLSNPYGMAMDQSGYIYVSNFDTNSISKVENGYQIYAHGLYNPWGIVFTQTGTMFIVNQGDLFSNSGGSISMVTVDGRTSKFIKPFNRSGCGGLPNAIMPVGITVGFQDNLYIATYTQQMPGSTISEVTTAGNAHTYGDCHIYDLIENLYGISFSAGTGLLYVSDELSGKVFTLTSSPNRIYNFASGFVSPKGLAIDSSGNVYIANAGNGTISQTTSAGTFTTTYASGFSQPSDIAFDDNGNLFVSDYTRNSVSLITPTKHVLTYVTGIPAPTGIKIRDGIVYVTSESEGRVYKITHLVSTYATGFSGIKDVEQGVDRRIYVADAIHNTVYRIDTPDVITTFAQGITSITWFVFDISGNLYASDFSNTSVLRYSNNFLTVFASGMDGPTGIAYDSQNNLFYVANYINNTLSVINSIGNESIFAVGLSGPMGVALLSPGKLYVANSSNGTIAKVVQDSGVSTFASGFITPIGITLDAENNLYITDQSSNMVYSISSSGVVSPYARIPSPYGIAFDDNGNMFVSDTQNNHIKEIILH